MTSGQDVTQSEREKWDFISNDGYVFITAEEFAELKGRCPSIRNVRRMVESACDGWLMKVPPHKRKQVLFRWLLEKAETMRPPKPKERRRAPAKEKSWVGKGAPGRKEQWTWQGSLPETFEEYAARFIRDDDDEETRRGILSRAREAFERRQRHNIVGHTRSVNGPNGDEGRGHERKTTGE
jgi:hypothetical protein